MNKERILAARKRLKEFQRNKKDQVNKNAQEHTDSEKSNNEQNTSFENSQEHNDVQKLEQHLEFNKNNGSEETNKSVNLADNVDYINNFIASAENISMESVGGNEERTNDTMKIPLYNNGLTDHNIIESFTIPSQVFNENAVKIDDSSNSPIKQSEYLNLDSNRSNSSPSLLQKEQLLQMTNAVANVLVDETNLEEYKMKNCDLEQKNQFLTCCLEDQKKVVNQLHIQVSQCTSRISELEAIINNKDTEFEARLIREINPLKEQIHLDARTIEILVTEKADLDASNFQCQTTIKQKTDEVGDLYGKLKLSQQQVFELERDIKCVKNHMEDLTKSYEQLKTNCDELTEDSAKLKKQNEDFELEISELRQKYNYKNTESTNLQQELQEKCALLSLSELRIQQLSNSPQEISLLETQHHATKVLEQQLSQMKETLEAVNNEKDEVSKKYQNYVQQLDERHAKLMAELETSKKVISDSEIREQSYIQRLSMLEQQLQKEKAIAKPNEDQTEKIEVLTKSVDNLVLEQENLQSLLNEKDKEIETLKKDLRELQDIKEQNVEASKLATALHGEQVGASRAVSQNQQLKTQLNEMNDAFIALSNTKLDLTERVQAERTISRKLNAQLNELEIQVEELKKELAKKDAALVEHEKEKLHSAQIEDQIQHYQSQSHNANTLQQELQKAFITIENLKKENQLLQLKLDETKDKVTPSVENNEPEVEGVAKVDTLNAENKLENNNTDDIESLKNQSLVPSENNIITSVPEPIKKLESRFKETMDKIAELTDENQRLEHLVLQLQGETETIGEYVTLYQKQRSILQQKAKEKESTFRHLLEQRNHQQIQLHKLKVLVNQLLKSKNLDANVTETTVYEENVPREINPEKDEGNNSEVNDECVHKLHNPKQHTDETTSQILELLSEVVECNNSCILEPNFHPCPWCSGKLITI